MKKLTKISLKDAAVLDDKQLKSIYGGSGAGTSGCGTVSNCSSAKCFFSDGLEGHCGIHSKNVISGGVCGCISGL